MAKFLLICLLVWLVRTDHFHSHKFLFLSFKPVRNFLTLCIVSTSILLGVMAQVSTYNAWQSNAEGMPNGAELHSLSVNGIGLVPPQFNNFRVDYGLSIFVDSKAPPFDGESLVEWKRRLAIAEHVQLEPNILCSDSSLGLISWALIPSSFNAPNCFGTVTNLNKDWVFIQK